MRYIEIVTVIGEWEKGKRSAEEAMTELRELVPM